MEHTAVTIDQNLIGKSWIGKVDSVFNTLCNIALDNDEVLMLSDASIPMMPNGIAINGFRPGINNELAKGQCLTCNGEKIVFGDLSSINIKEASSWSGKVSVSNQIATKNQLNRRWYLLSDTVKKALPHVLAQLAWHPWFKMGPLCTATTTQTIMSLASHPAPHSNCGELLMNMIGIGPGLTPSGDDFIVGYLAACHSHGDLEAQIKLKELDHYLRSKLQIMTTKISSHYLIKALQGEFVEKLILLMSSFIKSCNNMKLRDISNYISNYGHSSGLDCCFGILVGSAHYCGVKPEGLNELLPLQLARES